MIQRKLTADNLMALGQLSTLHMGHSLASKLSSHHMAQPTHARPHLYFSGKTRLFKTIIRHLLTFVKTPENSKPAQDAYPLTHTRALTRKDIDKRRGGETKRTWAFNRRPTEFKINSPTPPAPEPPRT